jgi:hypothetical protein
MGQPWQLMAPIGGSGCDPSNRTSVSATDRVERRWPLRISPGLVVEVRPWEGPARREAELAWTSSGIWRRRADGAHARFKHTFCRRGRLCWPGQPGCRGPAIRRTSDGGRHAGLHRLRVMAGGCVLLQAPALVGNQGPHPGAIAPWRGTLTGWPAGGITTAGARSESIAGACPQCLRRGRGRMAADAKNVRLAADVACFAAAATHSLAAQVLPLMRRVRHGGGWTAPTGDTK